MNAVYKLIFNLSTGTWAAASELTSSRGKKSRTRLAAAMAVALVMPAGAALAADSPTALQCAVNEAVSADGLRCEGSSSTTTMSGGIGTQQLGTLEDNLAFGDPRVNGSTAPSASGANSVALGRNSQATAVSSTALGFSALATGDGSTAAGVTASAAGLNSVAMGLAASAGGDRAIGIGNGANASLNDAIAIGDASTASAADAIAIGSQLRNAGASSILLGNNFVEVDAGSSGAFVVTPQGGTASAYATPVLNSANAVAILGSVQNATNGVAIGSASSATAAGAVALGAGSLADVANTVSVGTAAAQRKIVNMGAGTAATDAVNVSQLTPVIAGLGGGANINAAGVVTGPNYAFKDGTIYNNVGGALGDLDTRVSGMAAGVGLVSYDVDSETVQVAKDISGGSVSFAGQGGASRVVSGVANGSVAAGSTQAINGSQLNTTNGRITTQTARVGAISSGVAAALGGSAAIDPITGVVTAPSYSVGSNVYNNVGDALTNIDGRTTNNTTSIDGNTTAISKLNNGTAGLVQQVDADAELTVGKDTGGAAVNFAGTSDDRKLIGVAAGTVGAASNEAINGSQLYGTAQSVADSLGGNSAVGTDGTITKPVYNIGGRDYTGVGEGFKAVDKRMDGLIGGTEGLVTYDDSTGTVNVATGKDGTKVNFAGNDVDRTLSGVARGMAENDAANIAQLKDVTAGLGGNATVNPDGTITGPTYRIGAAGTEYNNVGDALTNIDGRTTTNEGNITTINTRLDGLADGTVGLVQQAGTDAELTVGKSTGGAAVNFAGSSGDRKLTGVAAGDLTDTSSDAVNGSQLKATNDRVAVNENDITNLDGRVTTNEGDITNLNTVVQDLSNGTAGLVKQDSPNGDVSIAAGTGGTVVKVGGAAGPRRLSGVENGMADTDAATIAQLRASGLVDRDGEALGAVVYDDMSLARATLGGSRGTVLGNVGNGLIGAGSMEAINGGQLFQMNADWESKWSALDGRVGTIERGVGDGSIGGPGQGAGPGPAPGEGMIGAGEGAGSIVIGDGTPGGAGAAGGDGAVAIGGGSSAAGKDSVAIGSGSIADREREVSVGAPGAERVIGNVAAGTRPTDAVNLKQMDDRFAAERDWSNSRFQAVDKRIDRMGAISAAYAGMAINTAGLNGDNRVGAGIGSQNGRSALAVGYQRILGEKKNVSVSLGGAFSGSDQSVSAGAGFSW
ncbi:ESPR-type extended signal peptide-containing protein [Stenotrophomonas sp. CFBP 13725]|uniref:YadA family autotransporter adhesin n=1 Tax=Stenotrophomonas sp. CFBP 13725 TaxID=2775297 RepID=UPI001780E8D0|nr:ESPR-type extended signal peptide-containing protein [Stenotrophomonas sp. CFBP 13725]MBD8636090.1 YadA-like family protein [Stenotrophomonas sp. CFBP 13725]